MARETFAADFTRHFRAGRCAPAYRNFQGNAGSVWTPARFINAFTVAMRAAGVKTNGEKTRTEKTVTFWMNGTLPRDEAALHAILAVFFSPDSHADDADREQMRKAWATAKGRETTSAAETDSFAAIGEIRTAPDSPWEVRGQGKAGGLVDFVLPPPRPDNDGGSLVTGTLLISEESLSAPHPHRPDTTLDFCIGLLGAELTATAKGCVTGLDNRAKGSHPHLTPTAAGWRITGPNNPMRDNILDGDVIDERQLVRLAVDGTQQGSATFEIVAQAGAFAVQRPRFVNEPMPELTANKQVLVSAFLEKRFRRDANGRVVLAQQILVWRGQA